MQQTYHQHRANSTPLRPALSNLVLDTSEAATNAIDYVATDGIRNTAAPTRTVIISSVTQVGVASTTSE